MDSILNKLSELPLSAKQKMSSPAFLSVFSELDKKYNIKCAMAFVEFACGYVKKQDLPIFLSNKLGVKPFAANEMATKFAVLLNQLPELQNLSQDDGEDEPVENLQPSPRQNFTSTARNVAENLSFDAEDEREIAKFKQDNPSGGQPDYNYDQLSDIIIKEFGFNAKDEVLLKRLKNIVILKLKDIRDEIETKDALTKSQKVGGMELAPDRAESLVKMIRDKQSSNAILPTGSVSKISFPRVETSVAKKSTVLPVETKIESPKIKTLTEKMVQEGVMPAPVATSINQNVSEFGRNNDEILRDEKAKMSSPLGGAKIRPEDVLPPSMSIEEEDGLPVVKMTDDLMVMPKAVDLKKPVESLKNNQSQSASSSPQQEINSLLGQDADSVIPVKTDIAEENPVVQTPLTKTEPLPTPPPVPTPYSSAKNIPQRVFEAQNTRRPIVDGVRLTKKLTGPIEELGEMTLIEFRRLAANPQAAADEIREKIKLLQDESYTHKMEGINAWFKNEINKFYRLLGGTAMDQHRNIDDIIKERLLSGKPTLTSEEFDAIMKLNKDLRY